MELLLKFIPEDFRNRIHGIFHKMIQLPGRNAGFPLPCCFCGCAVEGNNIDFALYEGVLCKEIKVAVRKFSDAFINQKRLEVGNFILCRIYNLIYPQPVRQQMNQITEIAS